VGGAAARIVTHRRLNSRKARRRLIGLREQANMTSIVCSSDIDRGLHNGRDRFGRQRIAQGLSRLHYPIIQHCRPPQERRQRYARRLMLHPPPRLGDCGGGCRRVEQKARFGT
jgi:hypothetical protein